MLITCRIAASDYQFDGFQDVEVADFTREQIHDYARKWFATDTVKYDSFISELYHEHNTGLLELCSSPLLLSMLCLAFDDNMRFPERRADLYDDAIEALLRKWDSSRNIRRDEIYRGISRQQKQYLLAEIAAQTFEAGDYFFPQHWLEERIAENLEKLPNAHSQFDIDGGVVLKAIEAQHGLLVERAKRIYAFSHLTFQEYLTAKYIVENEIEHTIKRLIRDHLTDDRWREVFLFTAGTMGNAERFFQDMRIAIDRLLEGYDELIDLLRWVDEKAATSTLPVPMQSNRRAIILFFILVKDCLLVIDDQSQINDGVAYILSRLVEPGGSSRSGSSFLILPNEVVVAYMDDATRETKYKNIDEVFIRYVSTKVKAQNRLIVCRKLNHFEKQTRNRLQALGRVFELYPEKLPTREFAVDQIFTLSEYLDATSLFCTCLSRAVVAHRKAIEESVYSPPGIQ